MNRSSSKGLPGRASKGERSSSKKTAIAAFVDVDVEDPTTRLTSALSGAPESRTEGQVSDTLCWWLKHLPASGADLALELRAPDHVLLEVFRRGRAFAHDRGKRIQEEFDEVRYYTIVLTGRCKLRCSNPAPMRPADKKKN